MISNIIFVFIRTIVVLGILFVLTKKLMGKKQISQMNIFDYIVGITIGSVVADISLDLEKDFIIGIVSLIIFSFSSYLVTYFSMKSLGFMKMVCGNPTVLIEKGKLLFEN